MQKTASNSKNTTLYGSNDSNYRTGIIATTTQQTIYL